MAKKITLIFKHSWVYIFLIFFAFLILVPIYWALATSFKTDSKILIWPPQWIPNPISLLSYVQAFKKLPIGRMAINSVIVSGSLIVTNLVFSSLAGYTFARKSFPGREVLFSLVISTMMIPMYIRLIPLYQISLKFGMGNSYPGLIMPTAVTAFGIFLMRQYFYTLPLSVEDAARVDGCGDWGILFRIVIPESKPALTSLALFTLVSSLGDFLWPLIITTTTEMRPFPVGIILFIDKEVYNWGPIMAMVALMVVPVVIAYACMQSHFIRGLTAGAVKE